MLLSSISLAIIYIATPNGAVASKPNPRISPTTIQTSSIPRKTRTEKNLQPTLHNHHQILQQILSPPKYAPIQHPNQRSTKLQPSLPHPEVEILPREQILPSPPCHCYWLPQLGFPKILVRRLRCTWSAIFPIIFKSRRQSVEKENVLERISW